jgi:uncharacterized DUF497 family protein
MNLIFEWDPDKAEANLRHHGVSLEEAMEAFLDPNVIEDFDTEHSVHESRYNLIGLSSRRLLFVVYSEPEDGVIRIISARKAERKHRRVYEQ